MLKEFKDFLMKGNLIELAVALVMGLAFVALVNALVSDLVMPIIAAIIGKPNFNDLTFHDSQVGVQVRLVHHGSDHVHLDRRGGVLLRRQAGRTQ